MPGFWAIAAAHPEWIAVVDHDAQEHSYGELSALVNRLSHGLRGLGLQPGDIVAVLMTNHVDYYSVVLAAEQLGLYITLINSHLLPAEISYILKDSDARVLLTDTQCADAARAAADEIGLAELNRFCRGGSPGFRDLVSLTVGRPTSLPSSRASGRLMLYTSGTSGRPKGVRNPLPGGVPEQGIQLLASSLHRLGIKPADHVGNGVHLVTSPLYHAAPWFHSEIALHLGHKVVLMEKWNAELALELIEHHQVTWTHVVPTMLKRLLDVPDEVRLKARVESLKWVIHAGAACPVDVKRRILDWLGPVVFEYYSSTEGGGTAIGPLDWLEHPGSVGKPWEGADVKILDDDGRRLAPGEVGTIYMKNLKGFVYYKDADKTERNRRGDYFTVGDLGWLDEDGYLFIADRRTDLIISGGVNIYPAEIESVLLEHPGVADAAVIGVPSGDLGQEVKALVECRPWVTPDPAFAAELMAHCRGKLAAFKCPKTIEFRQMLPRTEVGKLMRRALRAEYWPSREP
jgi:long-chain acyl-CoA synthetase